MRHLLFLLVLLLRCSGPSAAQDAPRPEARPEIRGIWIHTYESWDWDAIMPKIAAAGFNCVFVRVARGVNAIYPSQFLPRDGWAENAPDDELAKAIAAAHRNGLQFHAWKVNFNASAGPKGGDSVQAFYGKMLLDDRLVRDPDGKPAPSLNPADPRNQRLEVDVMTEIATKYPVDGIHFDYIRYPDSPSFDFDYGAVSRREFEAKIGRAVADWPRDVISGEDKIAYEDWERDNVNGVVQRVHDAVKKLRPECQISAAVWRKHRRYRAVIKQDWIKWVDSGWLDFVCPMDYTKDMDDFRADVRSQVANTSGKIPLAAGIGSYVQATPDDVIKQIQIAREEGADGYVLFDYKREGMDAILEALATGPQKEKVITTVDAVARRFEPENMDEINPDERMWILNLFVNAVMIPVRGDGDKVPIGLPTKDNVMAFESGTDIPLLLSNWRFMDGRCSLTLEDLKGNELQKVEVPDLKGVKPEDFGFSIHSKFKMPAGRCRLVLRGTVERKGVRRLFMVRGPILEGVSANTLKSLLETAASRPADDKNYVAIYADGQAMRGIFPVLQKQWKDQAIIVNSPARGHFPYSFKNAAAPYLRPGFQFSTSVFSDGWPQNPWKVKVLFLPQLNDVADLSQVGTYTTNDITVVRLRKWVNDGGKIILTHDAVGWRWHPRMFPQVGQGNGLAKGRKIEILPNDYGLTPGVYESNFSDHVTIVPGPDGVVLARDENGAPVMVGGKVGNGKVILCGQLLGYMPDGKLPPEEERLIQELAK